MPRLSEVKDHQHVVFNDQDTHCFACGVDLEKWTAALEAHYEGLPLDDALVAYGAVATRDPWRVYRCRWRGRKVSGIWGWLHKPKWCSRKPSKRVPDQLEIDTDHWCNDTGIA